MDYITLPLNDLRQVVYKVVFPVGVTLEMEDGKFFEIIRVKIGVNAKGYSVQYVSRLFEHRSEDYLLEHAVNIASIKQHTRNEH